MVLKLRGMPLEPLGSLQDSCMRRIIALERRERTCVIQMLGQGLAGQFPSDGKVFDQLKSMMSAAVYAVHGEDYQEEQSRVDEAMLAEFNRMKEYQWKLKSGSNRGGSYKLEVAKRANE